MPKTVIIIQARMGSSRLPDKVLINLSGKPILKHIVDRCKKSNADEVIIATSTNNENDKIEDFCNQNNIKFFRGSEDDVLERYYLAAKEFGAEVIIRVTGDCPLIDPITINKIITEFNQSDCDYLSNVAVRSYPRGLDTEIFSFTTLEKAHNLATEKPHREHVTAFIYNNPKIFKIENLEAQGILNRPDIRITVDTKEDLQVLESIFRNIPEADQKPIEEVIKFLEKTPEIKNLNNQAELDQLKKNKEEGIKQKIKD